MSKEIEAHVRWIASVIGWEEDDLDDRYNEFYFEEAMRWSVHVWQVLENSNGFL